MVIEYCGFLVLRFLSIAKTEYDLWAKLISHCFSQCKKVFGIQNGGLQNNVCFLIAFQRRTENCSKRGGGHF